MSELCGDLHRHAAGPSEKRILAGIRQFDQFLYARTTNANADERCGQIGDSDRPLEGYIEAHSAASDALDIPRCARGNG